MASSQLRSEQRRGTYTSSIRYGATGQRSTFGYWVPLVMTVTVATVGLAAWVWSERRDDEDDSSEEEEDPPSYRTREQQSMTERSAAALSTGNVPPSQSTLYTEPVSHEQGQSSASAHVDPSQDDASLVGRMSGALKRTPSPQQSYDWASKKVAAGVAAAGAVVGGALTSIREGSQEGYEDHERWSEEAEGQAESREVKQGIVRRGTADDYFSGSVELPKPIAAASSNRKHVAIVISAVAGTADDGADMDQHPVSYWHLMRFNNQNANVKLM